MAEGDERDAPCACSSGQNNSKCCATFSPSYADIVNTNRLIAYVGRFGMRRSQFCQEYIATKNAVIKAVELGLVREAAASDRAITCRKGCAHCCKLFAMASLQECEAIVYWLYQHEEALQHFLGAIGSWLDQVSSASCLATITRLYSKIIFSRADDEECQSFRLAMDDYESRYISCPFLHNDACTIYEVRPYVCATVVSISTPEWCHPSHPKHGNMIHLKTELPIEKDIPYFVRPTSGFLFASLPVLVYDILRDGFSALAAIPGLDMIYSMAMSDPAVMSELTKNY